MAVDTSIAVKIVSGESKASAPQFGAINHVFDAFSALVIPNGTGTGQADQVYSASRTLSAATNEDLDLNGALPTAVGSSLALVKIKLIVVYNPSATQTLAVKGGASNGLVGAFTKLATDVVQVKPGGFFVWFDPTGSTVTAGTGDMINVANNAGSSVSYQIMVLGTSA